MDLTKPGNVAQHMAASTSEDDWNSRCDTVKKANGGYPEWWFSTIIQSGLSANSQARW